jgi:hypothetical protein
VRLDDTLFDEAFHAAVFAQLEAGLAARHIDLCVDTALGAPPAASEVTLGRGEGDRVMVAVRDAVTGKRLERAVDLAPVPTDARPLTVALAVDEMLRASWVELTLPDAPANIAAPPEISHAVTAPASTTATWDVDVALAGEHFGGGTSQLGADVSVRIARAAPLGARLAVGPRWGVPVAAADGTITWTGLAVAAGLDLVVPLRAPRWRFDVGLDGWLTRATISGRPAAQAQGRDGVATALYVDLTIGGAFRVTRALSLAASVGLGAPLHRVELLDGSERVAGLDGPRLAATLGASWRIP